MSTINEYKGTFTIFADINGNGVELGLLVIPDGEWYLVQLDGITLSKLEYVEKPVPHWHQIEGSLSPEVIEIVGKAIKDKTSAGLI